jgi:ferredoxin
MNALSCRPLSAPAFRPRELRRRRARSVAVSASSVVTLEHAGESRCLELGDSENILEAALNAGLDVPHDCRMGVCSECLSQRASVIPF